MANLILPSRRIAQPQDAAPIDWSNPLSSGLVFDVDGTSTLEKVSGVFGSSVGSTKSVDESIGHKFARASSQYINYGDLSSFDLGTSPFSFEFLVKLNSSASGSTRMQILSKDSASGRQIWTEFNTRGDGTTNDSTTLVWLNGSTLSHKRSPVGSTPANTLLHIVTQFTGTAVEFYINGVSVSVTTEPGGANLPAVAATSTSVYLGARAYSGNNDYLDGNIYIARLRNRALSVREVLELYTNPWQVYEKQNRVLYFDVGAGSTTGITLSNILDTFSSSLSFSVYPKLNIAQTLGNINNLLEFSVVPRFSFNSTLEDITNTLSFSTETSFSLNNSLEDSIGNLSFLISPRLVLGNTLSNATNNLDFAVLGYTGLEIASTLSDTVNLFSFSISPKLSITNALDNIASTLEFSIGCANGIAFDNTLENTLTNLNFQVSPRLGLTHNLGNTVSSFNFSVSPRFTLTQSLESISSSLSFTIDSNITFNISNNLEGFTTTLNFIVSPRLHLSGTFAEVQNTLSFTGYVNPDIYFEVIRLGLKVNKTPSVSLKINLKSSIPLEL